MGAAQPVRILSGPRNLKLLTMKREYEIFAGSGRIEITATSSEAKAYACGILEGLKIAGRTERVQVYNVEKGNKIFEC